MSASLSSGLRHGRSTNPTPRCWQIDWAAARPSAHAEMMLPGSITTSPPANTPSGPAHRVTSSTTTPPPRWRLTPLPSRKASCGS